MNALHEGKVAVVTGSARGMGQAVAIKMASRGAQVVGIDMRESDETANLIKDAGGQFVSVQADLTVPADVEAAHKATSEAAGGADILINVAGILPRHPWDDTDFDLFTKTQNINVNSMFLTSKAFVADMKAKGWGRVINFSSGIFHTNVDGYTAYMTSKASVMGFTRALAVDLGGEGITVNSVTPSFVVTPGTIESGDAEFADPISQMQIIKRKATPDDITPLVSFLASDEAGFITGQMMHADGGLVMN